MTVPLISLLRGFIRIGRICSNIETTQDCHFFYRGA